MVDMARVGYSPHSRLPHGWTLLEKGKGKTYFKTKEGKFLKNRRNVLAEMYRNGGFTDSELAFIRDGLQREGWRVNIDLPKEWMFKQYVHKIEGVDTDVLYLLSPRGVIFRSKKSLRKSYSELGMAESDFYQLISFKPEDFDEPKKLVNPDGDWVFDPACVPQGWKYKKYTFNSKVLNKVEEVHHYLTPDCTILRGRKQIYDYMVETQSYNADDFQKFHFNKKSNSDLGRPRIICWSEWTKADGLPDGWEVREGLYKYQKKVQYMSPGHRVFNSRVKVINFIKSGSPEEEEGPEAVSVASRRTRVTRGGAMSWWGGWREDYIPSLPGWLFSIGSKNCRRVIRYKSPGGEVFMSRGPLIRFLMKNQMRTAEQLVTLKKLLKTNQAKHFNELRRNDKFIKNFDADFNYLLFLKIRYENHDVVEVSDKGLPKGWKMKLINEVEYFKDPTGEHVFNSRRLVVEHLRSNRLELQEEKLREILDDSGADSELSDSEHEDDEVEEEVITCKEPIGTLVVKDEDSDDSGELFTNYTFLDKNVATD
eukprot:GFUD01038197.1.p1 GENE.GFUD01038197.1~~GFUD01038197.1.p1  ORF type:complete len:537 (+),score=136.66 GFUD01038197.1:50-1660(+)